MKSLIYLGLLFLTILSCSENKKDLKLELLNNQIFCVGNIKKNQYMEVNYIPNKSYDSLSKNILNYRITNLSNKKYYLMFNENSIGTLEHDYYNESIGRKKTNLNQLSFSLYKTDSLLDGNSTDIEAFCGNFNNLKVKEESYIIEKFLVKNKLDKTYIVKPLKITEKSLQGFALHPGETKYFTSTINLPYRDSQKWVTNIDVLKPNQGSISLRNDSIFTKSILSKNQKNEIKENGYILFNGIIYSNKVPVKLISIRNN